jgi:hypothetical protein
MHAEGSWLGQTFSDRKVRFEAHRAACCVYRRKVEELSTSVGPAEGVLNTEPLRNKEVSATARCSENLRTRTWLDVWTLATQSSSLHAIHLLPINVIILPSSACASTFDALSIGESNPGEQAPSSRSCLLTTKIYPSSRNWVGLHGTFESAAPPNDLA